MGSSQQGECTEVSRSRAGLIVRAAVLAALLFVPNAAAQERAAFRTAQIDRGRVDLDQPVRRAAYAISIPLPVSPQASAADIARAVDARDYGWDAESLLPIDDVTVGTVRHLRFVQTAVGLPVLGRHISMALDDDARVRFLINGFDQLVADAVLDPIPALGAVEAGRQAAAGMRGARVGPARLAVTPDPSPAVVWQVFVYPQDETAEYEVLVDAQSGEVVRREDVTARRVAGPTPIVTASGPLAFAPDADSPVHFFSESRAGVPTALGQVDATGLIFDPDPLATAGVSYGAPYHDAADADSPELNAERIAVTLRDITQGGDGLYRLIGPYVTITGRTSSGAIVYDPPAETAPDFSYTRSHDGFEAANVYYHLHQSQEYVQELGFFDLQNTSLTVNPAGTIADNSGWQASASYLFFGTGQVDDGEDASVIWHEYGHALLEGGAPGLRSTREGQALHEGWSDYWAASYQRYLVDQGAMARDDWRTLYRWDAGDGEVWDGRYVTRDGIYPEDYACDDGSSCDIYLDGLHWATALMEVHDALGRETTDRLNLLSHRYLATPVTFRDAGEAIIQADIDHFAGAHLEDLARILSARGLADVSGFRPVVTLEPLPDIEQVGGERNLAADILAIGPAVRDADLIVQSGSGAEERTIPLSPNGDGRYEAQIPLPTQPDSVWYWIRVVDENDAAVLLPQGAPAQRFSFFAGPDNTPPVIAHADIESAILSAWPLEVEATISDGLGVQEARVEYRLSGAVQREGSFPLVPDGGSYSGTFDIPLVDLAPGSAVEYRIIARDLSAAANETVYPDAGWITFAIRVEGIVFRADAEAASPLVATSGVWARDVPTVGTRTAATGQYVWGTTPDGAYPATAGLSSLQLPAMNLAGIDGAYLVFWHWYDLEHDDGMVWDGANLKVSTNGGSAWTTLEPEGGYPGSIASTRGNPLGGEPSFDAFSYGWQRVVAALPAASDVRVRFDFATDEGNTESSLAYAGWYVDDIEVVIQLEEDTAAPRLLTGLEPRAIVRRSEVPRIAITAVDDTGIGSVHIRYSLSGASGVESGLVRMTESPETRGLYAADLVPTRPLAAGDLITYDVRALDFSGNAVESESATIEVLLVQETNLAVQARPSGAWSRAQGGWRLEADPGALVLPAMRLGTNGRDYEFVMHHSYRLTSGGGARVEVSTDDGRTWSVRTPDDGYDVAESWAGFAVDPRTAVFDLQDLAGRTVLIRLVGEASEGITTPEWWEVSSLSLVQTAAEDALILDGEPALHANFPDPFDASTNITFELPEAQSVWLAAYDVLGRRVAVLAEGMHQAGTHSLLWTAPGLTGGLYLLRFEAGGRTQTERVVLTR